MPLKKRKAMWLVVAGLLGYALFQIAVAFSPSSIIANDAVRGGWTGFCIGLELVGLLMLKKAGRDPYA